MRDDELKWRTDSVETLIKTPVFDLLRQNERAAGGLTGSYIALDAPDCVVIIPEYEGRFVLVRQWRHGADMLTTEFPGGVVNKGEEPKAAALRELAEETGYVAGKLTLIGSSNPNPALFKSRFYVFLASDLTPTGRQHLDADELVECITRPVGEVISALGSGEYVHAFMGTALAFYMRYKNRGI